MYVGLSAATGAGYNVHYVRNFDISTVSEDVSVFKNYSIVKGMKRSAEYQEKDDKIVAEFNDLDPNKSYLIVDAKNLGAPRLMDDDNLLYINQGQSDNQGHLSFVFNKPESEFSEFCLFAMQKNEDNDKQEPTPAATPTVKPTAVPTVLPTSKPTVTPTAVPTKQPTATPTVKPTTVSTVIPTLKPTIAPTVTPTAAPVTTPTQKAQSTPAANNPTTPVVTDNPITPDNNSARTVIVKKLKFKYSSKKVKAGKKVKLSKWLKVTKNRAGDAKITYKFTKSKYKKYATLSKKGVFKAKRAGKKKTVYVKAAAGDGSKKTAKIKIKIK